MLLALVGPPAQVIPQDDGDSLHQIDPPTPEPSPNLGASATVRHHRTSSAHSSYAASRPNQKYHHNKVSRGLEGRKNHLSIPAKPPLPPTVPKRHNCSIESLSTIAEESLHSYAASTHSESNGFYNGITSNDGYDQQQCQKDHYYGTQQDSEHQQYPTHVSLTPSSSLNGASVFVEPHVIVETTTYPNPSNYPNVSIWIINIAYESITQYRDGGMLSMIIILYVYFLNFRTLEAHQDVQLLMLKLQKSQQLPNLRLRSTHPQLRVPVLQYKQVNLNLGSNLAHQIMQLRDTQGDQEKVHLQKRSNIRNNCLLLMFLHQEVCKVI